MIEKVVPLASDQLKIRIFGLSDSKLPNIGMVGHIPCYRMPGGRRYLQSILQHLRKWRPDTVDVHNRPRLAYQIKSKLPFTRVLLTLHSTTFISTTYSPLAETSRWMNEVDGIVVNSKYLRSELLFRFPDLQVPILVNPLGVSLEDFIPRWTPLGESLRLARLADFGWENRKVVLYVGRLLPAKGVHHILNAWPAIQKRVPDAMLVIVGSAFYGIQRETAYVRELKKLAEPYRDHIAFLPYVEYPRVADYYNLADVVVVPSGEEEAFGLVNVEAMAAAIPVVATNTGGIPEVVSDGQSGLLLPPGSLQHSIVEYVSYLLSNEEVCREMGCTGRELARSRFRWKHTAERWGDLMKGIE
ncbi:glycosyltransferase family 4 protein [Paenibacillus sp. D2_2]|uniref:glycosyltransferase family 4 protein n=1 Tax=Paenibacillus sp. D2_2 TaxID=3073092 RepID=UPI00281636DB|nr:glycosyltransferase family 4 protein [Paenibacillus sp. D2_2]WMT40206.1 glycosyltransferase family 4 protein [Paenibacillus sp. D2_2]